MKQPLRLPGMVGAVTTVVLALSAASCGTRNDDINQIQPGYVTKSLFLSDTEWYYRRTIVKSETTNELAIEGQGDLWMDRVKFRADEHTLYAYRAYEAIPGAEDGEYEGKTNFQGSVLAS